ncbi:hypothetical protein LT493_20595 [Streptomyces tricolor]|nr:hypothetical protein [Streptomyces tricolor]
MTPQSMQPSAASRCTARPRRHREDVRRRARTGCSSNGPGDPETADHPAHAAAPERGTPVVRHLLRPADPGPLGLRTYKLRAGHRGINQPVQDRTTARSRSPRTITASPWTRRSTCPWRFPGRVEVSHVRPSTTVWWKGLRPFRRLAFSGPVPPWRQPVPPRRLPLRPPHP